MQFTTLALAALSVFSGIAEAQTMTYQVKVGQNGTTFSPNNLRVNVGDAIQFQFMGGNHTVTQSPFNQPCQPISNFNSSVKGLHSGFVPYAASAAMGQVPVWTIMVNTTNPIWLYCAQAKHCQNGMVMVINQPQSGPNTLEAYKAAAKNVAAAGIPGGAATGGSGTGTGGGSTTSPGGTTGTGAPTAGSSMLSVPSTLSILALVASFLMV